MAISDNDQNAEHFLELIKHSKRGKFKVYIGMSAGVGKTYRMLQEAHALMQNGINVQIGFIEAHGRKETVALMEGIPAIPRYSAFYKGKLMDEMDVQAILNMHPEVVLVDELAHTNVPGSKNEKRWQDVIQLLDAGINVKKLGEDWGFPNPEALQAASDVMISDYPDLYTRLNEHLVACLFLYSRVFTSASSSEQRRKSLYDLLTKSNIVQRFKLLLLST